MSAHGALAKIGLEEKLKTGNFSAHERQRGRLRTTVLCKPDTEEFMMLPAKQEALNTIGKLLDDVNMDEIMYRLYVLDKVRKGREDAEAGHAISHEALLREIEQW